MALTPGEKLGQIADSEITGVWSGTTASAVIRLTLPHGPYQRGVIEQGSEKRMIATSLSVPEELRQHGIAGRLTRGLARIAIDNDIFEMKSYVQSAYSLRILARGLGDDAVKFYDEVSESTEEVEIPMTIDQAIMSLELAGRRDGIDVVIDLAKVDIDSFESVVELNSINDLS